MVKRQRFTAEFKPEAVRLLDAGERPASEVAIDLGIRRNQLYKWKAQQVRSGELSFSWLRPQARRSGFGIVRLKRELARITEERDILKKRRRTLPRDCHEVRLHALSRRRVLALGHVSCVVGQP